MRGHVFRVCCPGQDSSYLRCLVSRPEGDWVTFRSVETAEKTYRPSSIPGHFIPMATVFRQDGADCDLYFGLSPDEFFDFFRDFTDGVLGFI